MCTAIEVTGKVLALQELKEQEALFRGAVELAELGIWSIEADTYGLTYSDRLIEWFGFDPRKNDYKTVIPVIQPEDRDRIAAAVARALDPASDGIYDESYTVIQPETNRKLVLHAQGRTIRDESGKVVRMIGTAKDITAQREIQLALENQVQIRTEELAATVEELSVLNEEMVRTNAQLLHSNEELGQYAHVASHDLQEPLRKIMIYSSMVRSRQDIPEHALDIISRIDRSAARMKQLVTDLLDYSRLLQEDRLLEWVDLNKVFHAILEDFELTIREKNALVEVSRLPQIQAVGLQMNQLFYNLVSNALKFTRRDVPPHITVTVSTLSPAELSQYIAKPLPASEYYHLVIADNGVGFAPEFRERIFEVFKRLHTQEHYPGSGIGLSMCRRIVLNHHGHLTADSTEGQGTEFHIILPDKQSENL